MATALANRNQPWIASCAGFVLSLLCYLTTTELLFSRISMLHCTSDSWNVAFSCLCLCGVSNWKMMPFSKINTTASAIQITHLKFAGHVKACLPWNQVCLYLLQGEGHFDTRNRVRLKNLRHSMFSFPSHNFQTKSWHWESWVHWRLCFCSWEITEFTLVIKDRRQESQTPV